MDYSEADGATKTVTLKHPNLVASAYAVYAGSTLLALNTDYTISTTTGVITAVVSGKLDSVNGTYTNDGMITVNYRYVLSATELQGFLDMHGQIIGGPGLDNNFDDVLPTGQTTVLGSGNIVYTDQYDTAVAWTTLGAYVYANAAGRLSTVDAGSQTPVGVIVELPTATSPWLGFKVL